MSFVLPSPLRGGSSRCWLSPIPQCPLNCYLPAAYPAHSLKPLSCLLLMPVLTLMRAATSPSHTLRFCLVCVSHVGPSAPWGRAVCVCLLSLIYSGAGAAADARVLGMDGFKLAPVVCCAPHEELGGGDSARASLKGKGTWSHSDCPEEGGTC